MQLLDVKWMHVLRSHKLYIPWTLKFKFLGKVNLFIACSFVLYIILVVLSFLFDKFSSNSQLYTNITVCTFLSIIVLSAMYPFISILKISYDFLFIHQELKWIFITSFIILLAFIFGILDFCPTDPLIMYTVYSLTFIPLSLIQTQWVLYQKKEFLKHVNLRRAHGSIVLRMTSDADLGSLDRNGSGSSALTTHRSTLDIVNNSTTFTTSTSLCLEDVLKSEKGFKIFANHLVRELTVEHLLFILECVQLKHEMVRYELMKSEEIGWMLDLPKSITRLNEIEHQKDDDYHVDTSKELEIVKPPSLSEISNNELDNKKRKKSKAEQKKKDEMLSVFTYTDVIEDFMYLCNNYIAVDAENSLNLSSKIRKKLISKTYEYMDKFTKLKLDKLHSMTEARSVRSLKIQIGLTPHKSSNINKTPNNSSKYSFKFTHFNFPKVASTEGTHSSPSIEPKSPSPETLSYEDIELKSFPSVCPSIRGGHKSEIKESEFIDFVKLDDDFNIIDHMPNEHALHYNMKHENVVKMKDMIASLLEDLDKSLIEVYRLIERDSYQRFTDTCDYIALEKRMYKKSRNNDSMQKIASLLPGLDIIKAQSS